MKPGPLGLAALVAFLLALIGRAAEPESAPTPLTRAHAHNDYEHSRPLWDALDQGFCSVEADIYLVNGQLLVAHDRNQVRPERTLQALYLDPLAKRIQQNGGRVFKGGPPVILLIDVKSDADATYKALRDVLRQYSNVLTRFAGERVETNALTAIISGNRARQIMAEESVRYAALDGRPEDLNGGAPKQLIPLISEDWKRLFQWRGVGPFPESEKQRLCDLVSRAHARERTIRFWGTPDRVEIWRAELSCGVDLLNADDLPGLRKFLIAHRDARH
jgi:hypothetical protein